MVTKFLPLPADSGVKQRTLATLKQLATRADVTLAAFDDGHADIAGIEAMGVHVLHVPWRPTPLRMAAGVVHGRSLSAARFWDRRLARSIREATSRHNVDVVVLEFAQMDALVRNVRAPRRVLATHNVESILVDRMAAKASLPRSVLYRIEARAVARFERRLARSWDLTVVVSDRDRDRLPGTPRRVVVCPNGQDPREALPAADGDGVVFVAHLGWGPNADAARWLGTAIWPLVVTERPAAVLSLVGHDPTAEVRALAGPGIDVVGSVPDVVPYLEQAVVALAPLRVGGGTRLKILEALLLGRPVVATSLGAEGLEDLVGCGLVIADEADAFARAIVALLEEPSGTAELGRVGHEAVIARYTWDATLAPLVDAVFGAP